MRRKKWLLIVPAMLAVLLAVDVLLRIFAVGVPPAAYCDNGAPRGNHRYQARNPYVDAPPDELSRYILCFGDSWTFGLGVQASDAWPQRLETILRDHDEQVYVANLATVRDTAADIAKNFTMQVKRYRAKTAVVMTGLVDAQAAERLHEFPPGDPFAPRACSRPWWRLGHELGRRRLAFRLRLDHQKEKENKRFVERVGSVAQVQEALFAIARQAEELGVRLVLVTTPKMPAPTGSTPRLPLENGYNFLIQVTAQSFQLPLCDLEKRWGDDTPDYLLDWLLWPMPNEQGHLDIARAVAASL
ncbi:MAG TPA: GDSL-type esterase/lipase family protein [bacterium]|nr:GDSL-type esterase/lipase family protein [bacterium]